MHNENESAVPKQAFDMEYATQLRREKEFLSWHGIEPTYVKYSGEYRIPTYKYKKTTRLFNLLASFYRHEEQIKRGDQNGNADSRVEGQKKQSRQTR